MDASRSSRIVLKAVATTWESSETMNEAIEVSTRTQIFVPGVLADGACASVMNSPPHSVQGCDRGRHRCRPHDSETSGKGPKIRRKYFFLRRILWPRKNVLQVELPSSRRWACPLPAKSRRRRRACPLPAKSRRRRRACPLPAKSRRDEAPAGPGSSEIAHETDTRAISNQTRTGGGERTPDRQGVPGAAAESSGWRSLSGLEAR